MIREKRLRFKLSQSFRRRKLHFKSDSFANWIRTFFVFLLLRSLSWSFSRPVFNCGNWLQGVFSVDRSSGNFFAISWNLFHFLLNRFDDFNLFTSAGIDCWRFSCLTFLSFWYVLLLWWWIRLSRKRSFLLFQRKSKISLKISKLLSFTFSKLRNWRHLEL